MASFEGRVSIDLGTGDGRLPYVLAAKSPDRLFIGVDANADALRELSRRAARARSGNLFYVRAAVEELPPELSRVADRVTVVLPWGSLLAALALPSPPVLEGIRRLCQPGAALTFVLDPAYAAAGFTVQSVRALTPAHLAQWPSTWARRLGHGRVRSVFQIEARAASA